MDRYQKGLAVMKQHIGEDAEKYVEAIAEVAPQFAKVNVEFAFGDIYGSEKALDIKTSELITIA